MGILEVKGINKRFGGLQALGDVNLSVEENTVHAIIGPNGAGKSTLLNVLVGKVMIPCFARRDGAFRMNAIGGMMDETRIIAQAEAIMEDVNMQDKRGMTAASLSRGDKRRLEMAMCLVQEPKLLLLDEPTAGMARADTNNTIDLLKEIKSKRDITMAIIEHDMHVVFSLAERITVLAQGTPLVEDTPENIKGHPKVREAYLGEAQV
jgi:branched-chain amino acid transport system ATP-binding protein